MNIYNNEKIVLFIDGPNLHATAKSLGFDVDYKKMLALFQRRAQLIRAIYYTTLIEQQEYSSLRPLVDWLEYNGYTMVTKPAKEFTDSMGRRRIKGSMDVELTVNAMQLADQFDHAIIFTGDGDFRRLVAALQLKGKRVSVVSTLETQPPMIADDLRRQADQFIDLADLEPLVAREFSDRRRPVTTEDQARDDAPSREERLPADRNDGDELAVAEAPPAQPKPVVKVTRTRSRSSAPTGK